MRERELEQIMSDFYHQKYNVIVCTTIIETGIDVPTANTIIMDRADKLAGTTASVVVVWAEAITKRMPTY